jgi:hypothetical protein
VEGIFELQHYLFPLLMQRSPSHILVIIVSHRLVLLLDRIHKIIPSRFNPKYSRLLYGTFFLVSFPTIFDMGEIFKENKGDLFSVGKIVKKEITF